MIQKIKNIYHFFVAILMNAIFLFPGRKLTVVGVTGTDGKTTTVNLIYSILKSSGKKVSMLTSIGASIGDKEYETGFHVTTPSSFMLQRFLRKALSMGSEYFVLEVTSHALDQYRTWGIDFKVGVLTNITSEHLDYHKTFDAYLRAKEKLLKSAEIDIVNRDDGSYTLLSESKNLKTKENWVTYGKNEASDINFENFKFQSPELETEFNRYNALAAAAACKALGITDSAIKEALKSFKMPMGRLDYVYDEDFKVLIDFAHTPNAFEQLLSSLRATTKGKIIHIFGSAGERDSLKRPFMGEISSKYVDIMILTSEDPRSEDPSEIISQIESGAKSKDGQIIKIIDRGQAISAGINMAKKGDLVVITGKAHEKTMTIGKKEMLWDEYKAVDLALSGRKNA